MDNAVKILADFIVKDKPKVIRLLNEKGYAKLPRSASVMEVNYAVADNLFNRQFHEDTAELIFGDFKNQSGPPPPLPSGASASAGANAAQGGDAIGYVIQLLEIGTTALIRNKQAENELAAIQAQADLDQKQIELQAELARNKAKQQFAFNLLQAQQENPQDNTERNLILFVGVIGFLALAYYATKRTYTPKVS